MDAPQKQPSLLVPMVMVFIIGVVVGHSIPRYPLGERVGPTEPSGYEAIGGSVITIDYDPKTEEPWTYKAVYTPTSAVEPEKYWLGKRSEFRFQSEDAARRCSVAALQAIHDAIEAYKNRD